MLYSFKKKLKSYVNFLPSYLFATFFAFTFDIFTYTLIKPNLGINLSAFISFLGSQIILFSILRIRLKSKITKKRFAFPLQFLIGIGTITIHLIILNLLNLIIFRSNFIFINFFLNNKNLYNSSSKILAAIIGFFWTSSMTRKWIFTSKENN